MEAWGKLKFITLYEALRDRQILHNFLTLQHQELDRPLPFLLGQPLFISLEWDRDRGLERVLGLWKGRGAYWPHHSKSQTLWKGPDEYRIWASLAQWLLDPVSGISLHRRAREMPGYQGASFILHVSMLSPGARNPADLSIYHEIISTVYPWVFFLRQNLFIIATYFV